MHIAAPRTPTPRDAQPTKTVAYLMSRFPTLTETFILYEILELERLGLRVEVFPLLRQREQVVHPEARAIVERAHYARVLSRAALVAQFYWLGTRPRAYLGAWWQALRGNVRSWSFFLRALLIVPLAALFARQIESLGVTHVHAHWATHPTLAAFVIQRLTGLPYSFTAHSHEIYVDRTMLEEKIRRASFVVTISEYNQRLLREFYGDRAADKTAVIHCGVDVAVFQPPPYRERSGPFTIVCVASLQRHKGHPYLIEACARLKAQGIPFRCLLVGEGQDRPQIEALIARLGLAGEVRLLGQQPRHRVSELLAAADVVTLQSIMTPSGMSEGIPVALMEAMAVGRPVIASALRGIPELVEHERTGLLIPDQDAQALADALLRIYREPEFARQLGSAARAKVVREFNLRDNAAALYRLLVQEWRAGSAAAAAGSLPFSRSPALPLEGEKGRRGEGVQTIRMERPR
jgi:glycosyltransferase involved in cell wall biosynthesis